MVPIREVLVHGLSGGRADGVCILSNLVCDIDPFDYSSIYCANSRVARKPEHRVAWRDIVRSASPTIRTILKIRPRPYASVVLPTNFSRATKNRESRRRRDRPRFEHRPFHEKPCNPLLRVADQIEKSDALLPRPNRRSPWR